ncbi:MAG: theronine dehydrogenase-like Zn-dependent dehydrogenase [Clostridiales bacterium]|nr:theronine dehydrogenase-like Zn-dependent dehydrogenase [Clostridiales bacterium]
MKTINLQAPNDIKISEKEKTIRKTNEVLIKVKSAGICGSDIGAFKGTNPLVSYPRIIGHEIGGEVLEVDENSKGIKVGDRVVIEPFIPCGNCYPCSLGRTNCCESLKVLGVQTDGGISEYFSHPVNLVSKVPDDMEWKDIAMIEPLTIALHSNHMPGVKKGEHVVITGSGTIGLLAAQVAMVLGAFPIVIDLVDERLELAKNLGIKTVINPMKDNAIEKIKEFTNGRMGEVVIEASGAKAAIQSAFDYVSYAGRICLVGWPNADIPIPTAMITKKELTVVGSRTSVREFKEAIDLIYHKTVSIDPIITKVVTFEEIPQVVEDISKNPDKFLKVLAVF